jgi:hypothetical protein
MGRFIVLVVVVGVVLYAWHRGWIAQWFTSAVDSGIESVRGTQRDARTLRPADPTEQKK